MADKSTDSGLEPINEQVVANRWSVLRTKLNQLYSKITELVQYLVDTGFFNTGVDNMVLILLHLVNVM